MLILATSDLHLPKGPYKIFLEKIREIEKCDLILIAGDVVDAGKYIFLKKFEEWLRKFDCPKIMVRGNNEYTYEETKKNLSEIILLEDEDIILEIEGKKIQIIGTPGVLDRPTIWQRRNIPNIEEIFRKRFEKVKELSKKNVDIRILLSHYAITFENIVYEPRWAWAELGSERWREILDRFDIVIHGHVHKGKTLSVIGKTRIYNASIWNGDILKITI